MKLTCVLLLALFLFSCGYGSNYNSMNPPPGTMPNISQLMPNSAPAGHAGFVLTINGSGFSMDSVVYWNSQSRTATYATSNQITTMVSAADVASPGMVSVYVHANGQNSNTMMFAIN